MLAAPLRFPFVDGGAPDVELRVAEYAPHRRQPPHCHTYSSVTLHLAGGIREWARGEDVTSCGLQVSTKPAGVAHADLYGAAGARTFQVTFSGEFRPGWKRAADALGVWRWRRGPAVRAALALLRMSRRHLADEDALREVLIGLLDVLGEAPAPLNGSPPFWLGRVLECLHDRAGERIRVREAATAAGVHPVHLARVFRRHLGCSVTGYVRRLRLERAASLLSQDHAPISAIAQDCGFADQSHLTRTLQGETGLTPAAFRRLAAQPRVASVQDRRPARY